MKHEISTQIANASILVAVGTSGVNNITWFDWISANASGISVIIGICSFIAAVSFYTISYFKQSQSSKNEIEISFLKDDVRELKGYIIELVALVGPKGESNEKTTKRNKTT